MTALAVLTLFRCISLLAVRGRFVGAFSPATRWHFALTLSGLWILPGTPGVNSGLASDPHVLASVDLTPQGRRGTLARKQG